MYQLDPITILEEIDEDIYFEADCSNTQLHNSTLEYIRLIFPDGSYYNAVVRDYFSRINPYWFNEIDTDLELIEGEYIFSYSYGSGNFYLNKEGKLHREDGPAVIYNNNSTTIEYFYLDGVPYSITLQKKIMNYKRKSSLTQYLLDNNPVTRYLAQKRLSELESLK